MTNTHATNNERTLNGEDNNIYMWQARWKDPRTKMENVMVELELNLM